MNFRKFLLAEALRKKPGPCGPGCSLPAEADNHLPEGNSWLLAAYLVTTWEERRQGCLQRKSNMRRIAPANNAEGRMSAMLARDAELICVNRETSRKS